MATPTLTKVDTAPPKRTNKVTTALRRFAISITIFNIVGYTVLGFEQPWLYPFVALATAYTTEILLEIINARVTSRAVRFKGNGFKGLVEFLLPAHITGLALNMLTYVNDRILVMIFGVVVAVGAKWILQAPVYGRMRHYMNPSNFGITIILLVFPWASIAPPYHFTEQIPTWGGWLIVGIILVSGTVLNALLTGRMFLIAGWLSFFVIQAVVRGWLFGTSIPGALAMATGVAFVLYTNYMVTDPGTSPSKPGSQFAFGAGVALAYGFFTAVHVAYGLFLATATVCLIRGMFLWALHFSNKARIKFEAEQKAKLELAPAPAEAGGEKPGAVAA
ncbi:enediyne biosynthesis protein [Amycolatopsis plumensis]|uniref:Enediyne biosynthesis protein n=1 Tax=Amycolatopsis plumensis TaxID=236508 RepID=A0ABV5UAP1_9PSEU